MCILESLNYIRAMQNIAVSIEAAHPVDFQEDALSLFV